MATLLIRKQTAGQANEALDELEARQKCIMKIEASKCVATAKTWKRKLTERIINLLERK